MILNNFDKIKNNKPNKIFFLSFHFDMKTSLTKKLKLKSVIF